MTTRFIESERDLLLAHRYLDSQPLPFTLSMSKGGKRSVKQNRLQMLWLNEIAQQKEDMSVEEVRAYCKLTIGVPILRAENETFREKYDAVVKRLPYEQKIALMMEPLDFPVTRLMSTKQATAYLDGIHRHFSEQGIVLTDPGDLLHSYEPNTPDAHAPTPHAQSGVSPTRSGGPAPREPQQTAQPGSRGPSSYAAAKGMPA
jgi:hypothetical protein